jgi:hypothetical protein
MLRFNTFASSQTTRSYERYTIRAATKHKEVQQTFLIEHATDQLEEGKEPEKFTALNIIAHILKEYLCENDKSLVLIQNTVNDMIRHNGQNLLKWLQSMLPIQSNEVSQSPGQRPKQR